MGRAGGRSGHCPRSEQFWHAHPSPLTRLRPAGYDGQALSLSLLRPLRGGYTRGLRVEYVPRPCCFRQCVNAAPAGGTSDFRIASAEKVWLVLRS